jgi:hypothetical protein
MPPVTRSFIGAVAFLGVALFLAGQSVPVSSQWTAGSRRRAEDQVATKLESMRTSAKLPKLKRAQPSVAEVQLVCTAALTGKKTYDPGSGALETYVTSDLSAETEWLKVVAFGTSKDAVSESRYKVYSDKDWGRYSVMVELNRNSTPDRPVYTVGVARRPSALMEILGRISFDNPREDSIDWKTQVDPACRTQKP